MNNSPRHSGVRRVRGLIPTYDRRRGRGFELVLSALVLMQEPGECMYARNMKAGLGFDRASEDEMKERQTVKVGRRGTVFQQGNEEENKECTHETAKLLNRTNNVDNNRKLLALHVSSEGAGRRRGSRRGM